MKIEYNIYARDERNASSKAKQDVSVILSHLGYKKLYNPSKYQIVRLIQQFFSIILLPQKTEIFVQYHSNLSLFYKLLNYKSKVKKIAIIHDLESLRKIIPIEKEIALLNGFDAIISHNRKMTEFLKANGVDKPLHDLNIFDYLLDNKICVNNNLSRNEVFFAGNLAKSEFLLKLNKIPNITFNLYGTAFSGIERIKCQINVCYKGAFTPTELISYIDGGWGLVWDGDSLETCSGLTGEYLRFNNPHKVSMCIVSERPVIVWKQSAMADYILKKNIGVAIENLYELFEVIGNISEYQYHNMLDNVKAEKERLIKGQNLIESLNYINKEMVR